MLRFAKRIGWLAALVFGLQPAFGFSLLGPLPTPTWQVSDIGYNLPGDIGTPHNLGEEYRWNTPYMYYAFDQNFLDYFGSNGVYAVEQAIGILNGLTNFSSYSADLTEVPLETRRVNYRAQALHLYDLKSVAINLMLEELALTEPDRYIWTLRTRATQPGLTCPFMIYGVIKWSFDPVNFQPTSYLNGTLYSYTIDEACSGRTPLAVTVPFSVDPLAVESLPATSISTISYGLYMRGLTRDDVGGLRYIYRSSNVNWESSSSDSTLLFTNIAAGKQLLFTSNLTMFASQALTNNAAALQALYPGLSIASTVNSYTNIYITNLTAYFTNYPTDPYPSLPRLKFATNITLTVQPRYHHIFNNVATFQLVNGAWTVVLVPDLLYHTGLATYFVQTTAVTNSPYQAFGDPPFTNITTTTYVSNVVVGDFFILTNQCGLAATELQASQIVYSTNVLVSATNNAAGVTNSQSFDQVVIDSFNQRAFTFYNIDCVATNVTLRQGMDRFTLLRANYDSLVGRFFQPITNTYFLISVTNSQPVTNWFQRIVTGPDFLFSAVDLIPSVAGRTGTAGGAFNDANRNPGLDGPGNIQPGKTITFNKVGPILRNFYSPSFLHNGLSELEGTTNFIWGSFDGTTNDPVVYPSGTSIMDLEAQILFQIITGSLPDGKMGAAYPATQLQAAGGVLPYGPWTWANGWPSLPPGLSLSPAGLITGTPSVAGTYEFTVSVMGGDKRTITRPLSININP